MLFSVISIVSVIISAMILLFNGKLYLVPLVFCGSFIALFLVWAVSCIICTLFTNKKRPCKKHSRIFRFYANCIIDSLMQIFRIELFVTGMEILPQEKFLLVGNHRSSMDPIIQMGVLRKYNAGFIAKQELFKIPVIGKIMHKCFCLSLNRGNPREDIKAISEAANLIKTQTAVIGIYPEGTRNRGNGLLPFKNGAFKIAQKANCPIVVVSIKNSEHIMKNAPFEKTDVHIDFLGVIDADYVANHSTAEISEKAKAMLEEYFTEQKDV